MESFLTGAHIRQNKHLVDFEQPIVPCKADTHTYSTSVFKSLLLSPLCRSEWKNIKGKIFPCHGRASISARREKQGIAVDKTSGSRGSLTPTWSPFFCTAWSPGLQSSFTGPWDWFNRWRKCVKHYSLLEKQCSTLPQTTRVMTMQTWKPGVKTQRSLIALLSCGDEEHYCCWPAQDGKRKPDQFTVWARSESKLSPPPYFTQAIKGEPFQSRLMTPSNFHLTTDSCYMDLPEHCKVMI